MGISSALLICNVNLIPVNAPTNSNRGILMAFSGANLDFVATNCMSAYSFIFILLSCILYGSALFLRSITKGVHNIRRQESKRIINSSFLQHVSFFFPWNSPFGGLKTIRKLIFLNNPHYPPKSLWSEYFFSRSNSAARSVAAMSSITSGFWDIQFRLWKLYFQVRLTVSTPPLPFQPILQRTS